MCIGLDLVFFSFDGALLCIISYTSCGCTQQQKMICDMCNNSIILQMAPVIWCYRTTESTYTSTTGDWCTRIFYLPDWKRVAGFRRAYKPRVPRLLVTVVLLTMYAYIVAGLLDYHTVGRSTAQGSRVMKRHRFSSTEGVESQSLSVCRIHSATNE